MMSDIKRWEVGGRRLSTIAGALLQPRHYRALRNTFAVIPRPLAFLGRYLLNTGDYPATLEVNTPLGCERVTVYSHHDVLTVNEIFCREDYLVCPDLRTVVDFGSNIGLSALYFLTRNTQCRVFLYEPVPRNVERLRRTLAGKEKRYELQTVCVATRDEDVEFGVEETGRYGGIGIETGEYARYPGRDVNSILAEVFAKGVEEIDLLKCDMEGIDDQVLRHIEPRFLSRIRMIHAELVGTELKLPGFRQTQRGSVSTWRRP